MIAVTIIRFGGTGQPARESALTLQPFNPSTAFGVSPNASFSVPSTLNHQLSTNCGAPPSPQAHYQNAESVSSFSPGLAHRAYPGNSLVGILKLDAPPMRGVAQPSPFLTQNDPRLLSLRKGWASAVPSASASQLNSKFKIVRKIRKVMQGNARVFSSKKFAFFSTPKTSTKQGNPSKNLQKIVAEMY